MRRKKYCIHPVMLFCMEHEMEERNFGHFRSKTFDISMIMRNISL